MRSILSSLLVILAILNLPPDASAAGEHHGHSAEAPAKLQFNKGKAWKTDKPLREGMSRIQAALNAKLPAIHEATLPREDYEKLAGEIRAAIDSIFQNCKLPPKADANLHVILAPMIEGTEAMRTGAMSEDRRAGAVKVLASLEQYPQYFAHPGWKAIAH